MKNFISIIMLICFATFTNAQNNNDKQWKEVTKLEEKGLTKSASELVDEIYNSAVKDGLSQERIKALLYKSKYMLILEEEAQLNIINLFKQEIENSNNVIDKRILENMIATLYWQYFKQNRYQFYNRTTTSVKVSDDFRTWDLQTLFNEIHTYYQSSLKNGLILQQEPLDKYRTLLVESKGSKDYRPTLFDLINHNALEFYKTDENSITKPSYKFSIDNVEYLSKSEEFINAELGAKDTLSLQLNALKIYQNLLKFHIKNKESKAFVYNNIERLHFVTNNATYNEKEGLLINALESNAEALKASELSALYNYEIAKIKRGLGLKYTSNTAESNSNLQYQWYLKEAFELCKSVVFAFPKSDGAKKCEVLMQRIKQTNVRLQTEKFIPNGLPSRLLVNYKNLDTLTFNIYKVTQKQLVDFESIYNPKDKAKYIKKLKALKSFESTLKSIGDYQEHSTEIVLPKLYNGLYIIEAKTNSKENVFATTHLQVSNFALIESTTEDIHYYQLIDRNNGNPIDNANIKLSYSINYNGNIRNKSFTTDLNGKFILEKGNNAKRNITIKVNNGDETAYFGEYYLSKKYRENNRKDIDYQTYLFTDRSIYRPGQTVYFKGIVSQRKNEKTSVVDGESITITLQNVNGEKLSVLELTTNEFGSVEGEFILPNSGLTGQYSIRTFSNKLGRGYQSFSVEEYKRPKFKPEFNPVTDTFKVNDSITVNGKAIAFAGSNITDAKVVYRVKRMIQYPRWYYWRGPYFNSEPQEITYGETKTDSKGDFEITFKAIPDETVSKDNLPIFNYEVTADITDINGETRSTTTIVNVGYHAMTLNIISPEAIEKSKKEIDLTIDSKNLNGESIFTTGTLKVYKLKSPQSVLRSRPWSAPDFQVISKEDFKKIFPNDPYNNEHDIKNWTKGEEVFNTTFNTEKDKSITLKKLRKWDSGKYIVIAESKDKFSQSVKDEVFVSVYSDKDKTIADNQLFEGQLNQLSYAPNEVAQLSLGSSAKGISVTVEVEKDKKIIVTHLIELNNSKESISIPVLADDIGGFDVHCSFAFANEYISRTYRVNVPYRSSDLEIITESFRDKLQPGQDETWSFTIKGPKGDKVSAELLASMYDASLDEFAPHNWYFNPIHNPIYYSRINKNSRNSFGVTPFDLHNRFNGITGVSPQLYDKLNWFGFYFGNVGYAMRKMRARDGDYPEALVAPVVSDAFIATEDEADLEEVVVGGYNVTGNANIQELDSNTKKDLDSDLTTVQIRKNLNETAFFFPQLKTDNEGNVNFSFKAPEALTKWKLQLLAHTKNLESTVTQMETVTQKELMVIPNAPRFLREGDEITIGSKIANLTEKELTGMVRLELTDPVTGKFLTTLLKGESGRNFTVMTELTDQNFAVDPKGNTNVSWTLFIPENIQAVQYKVIATTGEFSDGEQNALPVLSNRMLVTETLPMWVRSNQSKTFTLDKLKDYTSKTLSNYKLTLEMTSNPAWYAVQALPYLMEYPYDCNEQTFSRYYANALAQHIVQSNTKIEAVFNQWKSSDALLSNLENNKELKNILIQETPWLRDAQTETEQKKRIGLLFDLNKMNNELQSAKLKLQNNQSASGAWPWFNGGRDNRYITQHILAGFGHLKQLNVNLTQHDNHDMVMKALRYLDAEFVKEYKNLKKYNSNIDLSKDHLSYMQLHYLYVRSFYPEAPSSNEVKDIISYYKGQIKKYWLKRSLYAKGLMALTMHRMEDSKTSNAILKSLKENSITSDELGMYWKENTNSWHWYQAPIETQALLIEAFSEIDNDITTIDNLKIWLLKNKQTNQWKTTKATTEAVYALLLQGSSWLDVTDMVDVKVGNETISPRTLEDVKLEAGTGYYKTSWSGPEITQKMAYVTVSKKGDGIAWGAMYWQYFEDLDKITTSESPLKLSKKLFLKTNRDIGEEISEITDSTELKVGDLVRVRIELSTDRSMEFIHLKDMRASGLEPINVLSQYKWQDGLGYYESTKDASTNFFIDYLPKGIFVFEYDLRVNNAGNMSNGISRIQSMYAPEFSSHSDGVRIKIN
ncbi:alpha-2-macroglobulin family protein [Winogradskyella vincentii]|uniref:Alpha-2-macroglobulin n=1 Tax=Winogradskyella vincentii TaxID=2877122 RepID=A0ABS7Y312_9FLAO|nr:MG2 domain-containing protein [Winogradskyella vincentii]MCA0153996.1 alpha-2-macroglobulin [Winogradskyella vincentii]